MLCVVRWVYKSAEDLQSGDYWGRLAVYGGGGYAQYLDNGDTAYETIHNLQVNNWLDRGTRVVFIDFSLYNPNVNLFCIVRLVELFYLMLFSRFAQDLKL